jgi:hypothetical protein
VKPQATLADFTIFRTSASLPITQGPKLSQVGVDIDDPALVAAIFRLPQTKRLS